MNSFWRPTVRLASPPGVASPCPVLVPCSRRFRGLRRCESLGSNVSDDARFFFEDHPFCSQLTQTLVKLPASGAPRPLPLSDFFFPTARRAFFSFPSEQWLPDLRRALEGGAAAWTRSVAAAVAAAAIGGGAHPWRPPRPAWVFTDLPGDKKQPSPAAGVL